jgi:serine/threonine protein kinase
MAKDRPRKKKRRKTDPGSQTNPDAKMVNALESDPEFFKDPLIGKQIGKCKIEKLIGEGRTSVVYRAHYAPLKRTVAVKVLQESMIKYPAVVKVFQQEGRAVAALDHENVLKIYDVGREGDHYYLVLELLRGRELQALIDEKERLDVDEALEYVAQAARGLAAAHRKKLVHRDIKPSNLVIEPDGKLKIVDFGLAAEAEGAFSGGRLGTPHYMSPEQCRGGNAGTASDIYALGITLFHALVGHPPFAGSKTTEEITQKHLEGKRLEPEKIRTDIPRRVGDLVRRMTRMNPDQRPTAQEVYQEISQGVHKKPRTRATGRARRAARTRHGSSSSSSLAPLAIGGVLILALLLYLLMSGSDDDEGTEGLTQPERRPEPERTADRTPEPDQPERDVPLEQKLENDIKALIEQARREETTGNLQQALDLWRRVLTKSPPESRYYKEALAAKKGVEGRLKAERGFDRPKREYVSVPESEAAGREFAEKEAEFKRRITEFQLKGVRTELEDLVKRTREGSAERGAIDLALQRLEPIEHLFAIVEARAPSLQGQKREWFTYDFDAKPDELVVKVSSEGVELQTEGSASGRTVAWSAIDPAVRIAFIEAMRNPKSGRETMWLGYYCQLVGDPRAEQYYTYAEMNDNSPAMRKAIAALKGE